jgi:transcription elongation GreA/GreB family factor
MAMMPLEDGQYGLMARIQYGAGLRRSEVVGLRVMDIDLDEEEKITLVGDGDEDYDNGRYLITSPIGRGLLGKKKGEVAEIQVPKGVINFKVLEISYD